MTELRRRVVLAPRLRSKQSARRKVLVMACLVLCLTQAHREGSLDLDGYVLVQCLCVKVPGLLVCREAMVVRCGRVVIVGWFFRVVVVVVVVVVVAVMVVDLLAE